MVSITRQLHSRLEEETARTYVEQGYTILAKPEVMECLPFLQQIRYIPDIVAVKYDEKGQIHEGIVAEIKSLGSRPEQSDKLDQVIREVRNLPRWRFELVIRKLRETALLNALLPVLSLDQIKRKIERSQRLAQAQANEDAFLILWTAVEAILRRQSRYDEIEVYQDGTLPLLSLLYTDGSLEEEDYQKLRDLYPLRNRLAHGFVAEDLSEESLKQLSEIANRLLAQLPVAA